MLRKPLLWELVPVAWQTLGLREAFSVAGHRLDMATAASTVARDRVFHAFTSVGRPEDVKVVILGQNPYHTLGKPNGLAFGIQVGYGGRRDYSSMSNIAGECAACGYPPPLVASEWRQLPTGVVYPIATDLDPEWATLEHLPAQGVLLTNTALSCAPGEANSHLDIGWARIVQELLLQVPDTALWLCWGAEARAVVEGLAVSADRVLALTHPSKYSATRATTKVPAFVGSRWPERANELLAAAGNETINWGGSR